jgi:hypothetical protein
VSVRLGCDPAGEKHLQLHWLSHGLGVILPDPRRGLLASVDEHMALL